MLKPIKTGVSTSKRVFFQKFLPSLASVMASYHCFCSFLLFFCRSTCQFRRNRYQSNHMLIATSHIVLEFLTKLLNMSKLQNCQVRLISIYHRVPLHHSPVFTRDVPVMLRDGKHLIIFVVNRETKLMLLVYSGTIIFC